MSWGRMHIIIVAAVDRIVKFATQRHIGFATPRCSHIVMEETCCVADEWLQRVDQSTTGWSVDRSFICVEQ